MIEHLVPVGLGQLADRGAGAVVEVEPDRVVHPPPGCGVQRGDVADQVQGGARAVAGDQQVAPVPGRELRDRLVEDLDVVDGGVGAGVARAQPKRQRLAVGSGQGAVSGFHLVRFPDPSSEPAVPVSEQPALHKPRWVGAFVTPR